MAELLLHDVEKKLSDIRVVCPNLQEDVYLLTDYMSKLVGKIAYSPENLMWCLLQALENINNGGYKGKFPPMCAIDFPQELVKNKRSVLAQADRIPEIIFAISHKEFAEKFRKIYEEVKYTDISKKLEFGDIQDQDDSEPPEYIKVAVNWWVDSILGKRNYNKVDSKIAMVAMMMCSDSSISEEKINKFKDALTKVIQNDINDESNYGKCHLMVDYDPDFKLLSVVEYAGINKNRLPIKTSMFISKNDIHVCSGGETKIIWEKE